MIDKDKELEEIRTRQLLFMMSCLWRNPLVDKHSERTERLIYIIESVRRNVIK